MIRSFFLLLFCSLALPLMAEEYDQLPVQQDRRYYQLNGAVLQVLEKQWLPSPDSLLFSTRAVIVPDNSYRLERSQEMLFDSTGKVLHLSFSEPDERKRNELKATGRSFYYQKDKLSAVRNTAEQDKADSVAFHYRKKGVMDYYAVYNGKDMLQYKMTYVYKNGKVVTLRKNNKDNEAVYLIRYKYSMDELSESQRFDNQFRLQETRRYSIKYLADGQRNESYATTAPDGRMKEGLSVVKNSQGRVLEQNVIDGNREVTEYRSFQYDAQGQPVEEKIFSSMQESSITNRYTYDDKGNWTKKEIFYSGQLRSVVVREIRYAG